MMKRTLPLTAWSILFVVFLSSCGRPPEREIKAGPPVLSNGKKQYLRRCKICHGEDGRAKTHSGPLYTVRNLTDPAWQAAITDRDIMQTILRGKNQMPSFARKFNDQDIVDVAAYVRTLGK